MKKLNQGDGDGRRDNPKEPQKRNYHIYFIVSFILVALVVIGGLLIGSKSAHQMPGDQGAKSKDTQTRLGQNNASKPSTQVSNSESKQSSANTSSVKTNSNSQTKTNTNNTKAVAAVKVGEFFNAKSVSLRVNWVKDYAGDKSEKPDNGKQYLILNVTVKNTSNDILAYSNDDFKVVMGSQTHTTDESLAHSKYGQNQITDADLEAHKQFNTNLIAQVPGNAKQMQLQYMPSELHHETLTVNLD